MVETFEHSTKWTNQSKYNKHPNLLSLLIRKRYYKTSVISSPLSSKFLGDDFVYCNLGKNIIFSLIVLCLNIPDNYTMLVHLFMHRVGGDNGMFITLFLFPNIILIGWFIRLSVQTFQPLILFYRRSNLGYNHRGCTHSFISQWLIP